ncbi:MAG TPA: MFS transporter [Rhodothermales bacterium]
MPSIRIPALSESSLVRYLSLGVLYVAQGLPVGLLMYAFPAYFAENGLTPGQIGTFIGLIYAPWGLKLFAGPFMDRFSFLAMGRRRPWVLGAQVGTILCILWMAVVPDPLNQLALLSVAAVAVNTFMAIQDVAVDGMAVDVLPLDEQSRANGVMFGCQALGIAVGTSGGAILLSQGGIPAASIALASAVSVAFIVPLLLRERPGERLLPWSAGEPNEASLRLQLHGWKDIGTTLFRGVVLPVSLVALVAQFLERVGEGILAETLPILAVQELGWNDTDFSHLNGTSKLVAAGIGIFLGGWLADRFGRVRMIKILCVFVVAIASVMAALPALWDDSTIIGSFVVVYSVLTTLFSIIFSATMMALCWKRVAATQFSLYMAVSNVGISAGAALIGPLQSAVGYRYIFMCGALFYAVVFVLLYFVDVGAHVRRLEEMEGSYAAA